jgi:hypothetical protein
MELALARYGHQEARAISEAKIHSADIEPSRSGDHILVVNGQPAARFDCLRKAIAARELMLDDRVKETEIEL